MTYQKIDNQNFKEVKEEIVVYNLLELKKRKLGLQNDIARIQEEITEIDRLLNEAQKLGLQ